jgi:hypothetical protein
LPHCSATWKKFLEGTTLTLLLSYVVS